MANPEHVAWLREGVEAWNTRWGNLIAESLETAKRPGVPITIAEIPGPDLFMARLSGAQLSQAHLGDANLFMTDLSGADLSLAHLRDADLRGANLEGANLEGADLSGAKVSGANLEGASLRDACLGGAVFSGAQLAGANLERAALINTDLRGANLSGSRVYGISAWDIRLDERTRQANLIITPENQPAVSVDNIKVAQFVYLLLSNPEIREVIDTLTTKAVLILGRFSDEKKAVLDALRDVLRLRGYVPILIDFEKPANRDLTETVSTLAHLARFVIADLTEARSLPQELQAIVPNLPSVPIQPLIAEGHTAYGMFEHYPRSPCRIPEGSSARLACVTARNHSGARTAGCDCRQTAVFKPAGCLALRGQRPTINALSSQPRPRSGRCPAPRTWDRTPGP